MTVWQSSRSLALNDSTRAFCHGEFSPMEFVPAPDGLHQSMNAFVVRSGPLP
jgi:hypothetical protein